MYLVHVSGAQTTKDFLLRIQSLDNRSSCHRFFVELDTVTEFIFINTVKLTTVNFYYYN